MLQLTRNWLESAPWEAVVTRNQELCKAKELASALRDGAGGKVRQTWEDSLTRRMALEDALDLCRRSQEAMPFSFNNANTFAAVGRSLIEGYLACLSPAEAQIVRTTVGHYIAGTVGRRELVQVLRHFAIRLSAQPSLPASVPAATLVGSQLRAS